MIILSVNGGFDNFMEFIYVMIIFVAVLCLTVFATKWIGKFQSNKFSSGNIELLEAARLNNSQYIQLVRIGEKVYALAVSKDNITLVGELSKEDLKQPLQGTKDKNISIPKFADILDKVRNGKE